MKIKCNKWVYKCIKLSTNDETIYKEMKLNYKITIYKVISNNIMFRYVR